MVFMTVERVIDELARIPLETTGFELQGYEVLPYVSPEEMGVYLEQLSSRIRLSDYDSIIVNASGGLFLFDVLCYLQDYYPVPYIVEYHRPDGGYACRVDVPIPDEAKVGRILVVEDIWDSGGVLKRIKEDVPAAEIAVVVKKVGVANQINVDDVYVALNIVDAWVGGCGLNFGGEYPDNFPRSYPGLVIKP